MSQYVVQNVEEVLFTILSYLFFLTADSDSVTLHVYRCDFLFEPRHANQRAGQRKNEGTEVAQRWRGPRQNVSEDG